MFYFAYGSNLNKGQMAGRCPAAVPVGKVILPNARLIFRGVADVEYDDRRSVQGGLWKITKACERSLDRYEGVRGGLYRKEYITVQVKGKVAQALIYVMNADDYRPPSSGYLACIRAGYADFGLDTTALSMAVATTRWESGREDWRPRGRATHARPGPARAPRDRKATSRRLA